MMVVNVLLIIDVMRFCNEGKFKVFFFVSFISVFDIDYYIKLFEDFIRIG